MKRLDFLFWFLVVVAFVYLSTDSAEAQTSGPPNGWLVIQGGGKMTNETRDRFVALAGGPNAKLVVIPTAESDEAIDPDKLWSNFSRNYKVKTVTVLHTRDRARANSEEFVEPLKQASAVWIDGGRQWRLADAYLGTAVEREIKALLARGGVVGGGSAGASIQASFLVRGASGTRNHPDGDNGILMSPGHEIGFGLLTNSAIDQHIDVRGREGDLDAVVAAHPRLLGIGIDQSAAIVVHRDSFFVVGGQVAIHDGKNHDGKAYYFLNSGQAFNLKTRSPIQDDQPGFVLVFRPTTAMRSYTDGASQTVGTAILESRNAANGESKEIRYACGGPLYTLGKNPYAARFDGETKISIRARDVASSDLREYDCKINP